MDFDSTLGTLKLGIGFRGYKYALTKKGDPYTQQEVMDWLSGFLEWGQEGWFIMDEDHISWDDKYRFFYQVGLDTRLSQYDSEGKIALLHEIKKHLRTEFGALGGRFFAWWFFSTGGDDGSHNWVWTTKSSDCRSKADEDWDGCVHTSWGKYGGGGAIAGKGKHGSSHDFKRPSNRTFYQKGMGMGK